MVLQRLRGNKPTAVTWLDVTPTHASSVDATYRRHSADAVTTNIYVAALIDAAPSAFHVVK